MQGDVTERNDTQISGRDSCHEVGSVEWDDYSHSGTISPK